LTFKLEMPIHHPIEHQTEVTYETVVSHNRRNPSRHPLDGGQHRFSSRRMAELPSPILLLHEERSTYRLAGTASHVRNRLRRKSPVL
jgi:hypothetical protein